MKKAKTLHGGAAFDSLMGKLVQVPKKEADKKERAWRRSRAKKKAKSDGQPQPGS